MDHVTGGAKKVAGDAFESAKSGLKIGLFVGAIAFVVVLIKNTSK